MGKDRAEEALNLAGYEGAQSTAGSYDVPDDGIKICSTATPGSSSRTG